MKIEMIIKIIRCTNDKDLVYSSEELHTLLEHHS